MNNQQKSYLFAGLTILCWVTVPTAFKIALRFQDNFQLLLISALTSIIIFGGALIINGQWKNLLSLTWKDVLISAALGFLNPFAYYLILFKAYSILPGQIAQPLNMIWPIVLVLISIPLLKQKIPLRSVFALLISFSGVFFISSQGGRGYFSSEQISGVILALGSSVIWAFFWILNVKDKRDEILKLFLNFFFGLIFLLLVIPFINISLSTDYRALISGIYVGIFEMGIAFIFWLKALQLTKSTDKISNLIYISPFLSLFLIHYIAGEENIYYNTNRTCPGSDRNTDSENKTEKMSTRERIILGIDPGTNIMGYGVIEAHGKEPRLLILGISDMRKEKDPYKTLQTIFRDVIELIDRYHPDELAIEAPFFGKNVQSMLKLGRAQGAAIAAALSRDIPIYEYAPRKIKMAITGQGSASKEQVADILERILNFKTDSKNLDATDGLAAAVCHFFQSKPSANTKSFTSWNDFLRKNPGRLK